MTNAVSLKPELGRFGVWLGSRSITPELAGQIESLGYGAAWIGASPDADLAWVEPALEQTTSLQLATGIVNIWSAPAGEVAASYQRIESAHPGRFLLGVGVGHPEHTQEYQKPYDALVAYLDDLDKAMVPDSRRVLAALGPRMLRLAAQRSAGAHPYLTTPEHTGTARQLVGNTVFLAPEHKVVLTTDAAQARAVGRKFIDFYLGLSNYVNNWLKLGFTEDDVRKPGSDRLIDALVAYGAPDQIARRLGEHLEAGADHVAIQVLRPSREDKPMAALTELSGALGLTR
ncbi:LLM class F420-dependent oxidoreductase [Mycobacterium marinum]|uniref:LLM class F420-dependent oxidoreductase n=1 Tax=Mycobacterium marinum TaxID=1781 RepID=UPI000B9700CC|nr:LLM class F420-dependent oxidoreductase [Mycobacterium marinum]MDC8981220.1 LLM class F420-dependent oxidoreductase [Mycobacterium marinum]MDC8994218.1 LLM class F420-dependent oxidoreductase [Mycobacterium marinum]MDC8999826.1 LLM class F420-dependent oxidoreductase [Mycobacterium marinum]MDC9010653.1 LLM class F420-dependent oxidoreductase [Mycobacterium marinum]MDC9013906.1 LLM class F420-dependent oxidoreductase [Mycobacterium marinum]